MPNVPAPPPRADALSTDAGGFLTVRIYVPGAGDDITLIGEDGAVAYRGAGLGVPTALNLPLDPDMPPGDPSSPGQAEFWSWDLIGANVPPGDYTAASDATGDAALSVRVLGARYFALGAPAVDPVSGAAAAVAGSDQRVFVPVSLKDATDGQGTRSEYDPTGRAVSLAFTRGTDPDGDDFADAAWVSAADGCRYAACDISGLSTGAYFVYVRTDGFVGRAGLIRVR